MGLGKAYAHQVLDYTRSTTLNVFTLGRYGFFKFWWHIGEKAGEAIVESQRIGEHGFDVALSGLSGGLSAVSPLHQVAATITNIKTAAKEGDYERLGEGLEPVVVAIVATAVTGKLAGVEAGASEGVAAQQGRLVQLAETVRSAGPRWGRTVAVLDTAEGATIVGGGASDLSAAQKAVAEGLGLRVAPDLPGFHAEETVLNAAGKLGLTPTMGAATNNVCKRICGPMIESLGGSYDGKFFSF